VRGRGRSSRVGGVLLATLLALEVSGSLAAPLHAQQPRRVSPTAMGVTAGLHAGLDYLFDGILLGGQVHIMPDPWGRVLLMPNAQMQFRQGLRDWQANGDAAIRITPAFYAGGGVAYRNTIFDEDIGRETRSGYSVIIGFRDQPSPGRIATQIELRWSVISNIRPRMFTIGLNYPLLIL